MARRRRRPRPGGRPRGRKRRKPRPPKPVAPSVPNTPVAKLEEETRKEVAKLMQALMSEGGLVEQERTLARIVEQHPEYAEAFMGAADHFSSGELDSPFVHIGLHLMVERGVVSRDHQLTRNASDMSWHEAVHEQAEALATKLFPVAEEEELSEEAS